MLAAVNRDADLRDSPFNSGPDTFSIHPREQRTEGKIRGTFSPCSKGPPLLAESDFHAFPPTPFSRLVSPPIYLASFRGGSFEDPYVPFKKWIYALLGTIIKMTRIVKCLKKVHFLFKRQRE